MRITEIITEAEKSWWDATKEFGAEVGREVAHAPKAVYDVSKKALSATGDAFKRGDEIAAQIGRGWEKTKKDPMRTARIAGDIVDTGVRSMANMATFGQADKLAAHASTIKSAFDKPIKSSDEYMKRYEQEKEKEYATSAAARDRNPEAAMAGDVAGVLINPAFGAGAKVATSLATKAAPNVVKKAFAPAAGQTTKNVAKKAVTIPANITTGLTGGIAATKAGEKAVGKIDPTDPYYGKEEYRVFEERLKYLINYR